MDEMPNYGNPPVIEVVMGMQFAPLEAFTVGHLGMYWAAVKDEFVSLEEQGPLPHLIEPDAGAPQQVMPMFQVATKPDLPRAWFIDSPGNQVIQVQRDRFILSWRKVAPSDKYPRYPAVRSSFFKHRDHFLSFLGTHDLPAPEIDQLELTYVNIVRRGEGWATMLDLPRLFTVLKWAPRTGFLPEPETTKWGAKFLLKDEMGRLHLDIVPVRLHGDDTHAIRFSLTARGMPQSATDDAQIGQWFNVARRWIVKGFEDVAAEETDTLWDKQL